MSHKRSQDNVIRPEKIYEILKPTIEVEAGKMNNNLVQLACFIIFYTCLKEDEDLGIVLM